MMSLCKCGCVAIPKSRTQTVGLIFEKYFRVTKGEIMKHSPRSAQAALRRLIVFLLVLFLSAAACNLGQSGKAWEVEATEQAMLTNPVTEEPSETPEATATITPYPTVNPTKAAYVSGFAGSWDTNWGVMTCSVDGQMVNCNYTHDTGKLEATLDLDGTTMTGSWSEAPSYQPPMDGGRVTFSLSADGNTISGHWWYGQNEEGGPWTGTRR
jgi:hypothetical protein